MLSSLENLYIIFNVFFIVILITIFLAWKINHSNNFSKEEKIYYSIGMSVIIICICFLIFQGINQIYKGNEIEENARIASEKKLEERLDNLEKYLFENKCGLTVIERGLEERWKDTEFKLNDIYEKIRQSDCLWKTIEYRVFPDQ